MVQAPYKFCEYVYLSNLFLYYRFWVVNLKDSNGDRNKWLPWAKRICFYKLRENIVLDL